MIRLLIFIAVLFVAALGVFTALSLTVMTADTFRERLHYHRLQRERAHVYAHSPHCRAASRSKLGKFHRCDEAETQGLMESMGLHDKEAGVRGAGGGVRARRAARPIRRATAEEAAWRVTTWRTGRISTRRGRREPGEAVCVSRYYQIKAYAALARV